MSGLYNMVFGDNPMSAWVLGALGNPAVPRYRDAWLGDDCLVIYTRTGGGNRDFYENEEACRNNYPENFEGDEKPSGPWNDDLRAHPEYIRDEDDDFDPTYAAFIFRIPEEHAELFAKLKEAGAAQTKSPGDRWREMFELMNASVGQKSST